MSQSYARATSRQIQALRGMRDLDPQAYERNAGTLERLRAHMSAQGYAPIDTPLLEETELFVRKAGGELAGRLYTFTDPGGSAVSLRPEFTSSVIRHFVDNQDAVKLPARWQYSGPVFRYEATERGGYRQFTQSGAELVGARGHESDIEIVSLALSGLRAIGLNDFGLRIGHLGTLHSLLDGFDLSEPTKLFVMGNMSALRNGDADAATLTEHAREVGLLRGGVDLGIEATLESMSTEAAEEFILGALKETMPAPVGRRTTDDIIARLLRKVHNADGPDAFGRALGFADRLARLAGEPRCALRRARETASECGISDAPLDELEALVDTLPDAGVPITLDLGMARGISYYTGMIFELAPPNECGAALGGGGRYDGLVQALGGRDCVPALGFAYNVNALLDALDGGAPPKV